MVQAEEVEETSKHSVLGRCTTCSTERIKVLSDAIEQHSLLSIPKAVMMETGEIICEKVHASPRPLPKISFKDKWRKELG